MSKQFNPFDMYFSEWTPVTPEIRAKLEFAYFIWWAHVTEIRERMAALRVTRREGWQPDEHTAKNLSVLNAQDEKYAARDMPTAQYILDKAEQSATEWRFARQQAKPQTLHEQLTGVIAQMKREARR